MNDNPIIGNKHINNILYIKYLLRNSNILLSVIQIPTMTTAYNGTHNLTIGPLQSGSGISPTYLPTSYPTGPTYLPSPPSAGNYSQTYHQATTYVSPPTTTTTYLGAPTSQTYVSGVTALGQQTYANRVAAEEIPVESRIEYIPFEKKYIEYDRVERIERIPYE
jgi:hypothetical protein